MTDIKNRYNTDTQFRALVDMMVSHINQANYTPSEMRAAAILASIIHEEHNVQRIPLLNINIEKDLMDLHDRILKELV